MEENKNKDLKHPKNDDVEDAPESGTVIYEDNPSKPLSSDKDKELDSIGEAPESEPYGIDKHSSF